MAIFNSYVTFPEVILILLVLSREFSGIIHWLTINNHPSNPQQPIQQPCETSTRK